jgi:hypothetical protein
MSNAPIIAGDPNNENVADVHAVDCGIIAWLQARLWRRRRSEQFPRRQRTAQTELRKDYDK